MRRTMPKNLIYRIVKICCLYIEKPNKFIANCKKSQKQRSGRNVENNIWNTKAEYSPRKIYSPVHLIEIGKTKILKTLLINLKEATRVVGNTTLLIQ